MRAEIVKISSDNPEVSLVKYTAEQIRAGQVLGMPTDTFYGLAADPFNLRAVERVYGKKCASFLSQGTATARSHGSQCVQSS